MKNAWNTLWNNFKAQPDIWFFYGFILTFALSIRKVLFFYPLAGSFNEYTGIYVYLSDLFLLAIFIILILNNKYTFLSIFKFIIPHQNTNCSTPAPLRKFVPRGTNFLLPEWNINCIQYRYKILYTILGFIIWVFISQIWAQIWPLALFRFIKLFELFCLFLYIRYRIVPPRKNLDCSTWNNLDSRGRHGTFIKPIFQLIIALGLFQAIIGIFQFILQHSIGLFWLKESLISSEIAGVAKIILGDHQFIRAYGLFPHPNILGGFLLVSIILTFVYKRMFHVEHVTMTNKVPTSISVPRGTFITKLVRLYHLIVPRGTYTLMSFALVIQISAQMLTFSKSSIIGTITSFIALYMYINVPRGTFKPNTKKLKIVILSFLILITTIYIIKPNVNSFIFQPIKERLFYLNVSRGTIMDNWLLGTGSGQSVLGMQKYANQQLLAWQYQPVHNVFILIWSELGLIGLGLFIWLLCNLFHVKQYHNQNVPRGTLSIQIVFKSILIGFIFIMLFDHYFWDIQQGQVMLWLVMGFIAGESTT